MLAKCVQCGFNVIQNEKFCFNCGLEKPARHLIKITPRKFLIYKFLFFVGSFVAFLLFFSILTFFIIRESDFSYLWTQALILSTIWGFFLSFPATHFTFLWFAKLEKQRLIKNQDNLHLRKRIIRERLAELESRNKKINLIISQNTTVSDLQNDLFKANLLETQEVIKNQTTRYNSLLKRIELIRLQNKATPAFENLTQLSFYEVEELLQTIEGSQYFLKKLKSEIEKTDETAAKYVLSGEEYLIEETEKTAASLREIRKTLIVEKTVRALQQLQSMDDESKNDEIDESLTHKIEAFNMQATLTDFSEAFDKLETEYQSLKMENEISRELFDGFK